MAVAEQLGSDRGVDEKAACESLRRQVRRLERELSAIVADGFPKIPARGLAGAHEAAVRGVGGFAAHSDGLAARSAAPRLLTLGELEQLRDALALRVREVQLLAEARAEHERRARALLARMRLEPGRYKFMRLPVAALGEGGCGVWEVRPRLGLIEMLSGWWELKLSSGCP